MIVPSDYSSPRKTHARLQFPAPGKFVFVKDGVEIQLTEIEVYLLAEDAARVLRLNRFLKC